MSFLRALLASVFVVFLAMVGHAQDVRNGLDFEAWDKLVTRAEATIEADRASTAAMEDLRAEIVDYRDLFLKGEQANASKINTLRAQLVGLGPVPEGGEDDFIALRRADLRAQLSNALAPVIEAQEGYSLADALIKEIDRLIRTRLRSDFLTRGPSPLNFSSWSTTYQHLKRAFASFGQETKSLRNNPIRKIELQQNLPTIIVLVLIALVFGLRGRKWSEYLAVRARVFGGRGSAVWNLVVSVGRIVLPLIGLVAICQAILLTGLMGLRMTALLGYIPAWGAIILIFRWLCERVFAKRDEDALLDLPRQRRAEARWYGTLLAVLLVLRGFFELLVGYEGFSPQVNAIVFFPQVLFAGLIFFRLGQILRGVGRNESDDEVDQGDDAAPRGNSSRLAYLIGTVMMLSGLATPLMATIGYDSASKGIIFPMVLSVALFGMVLILQRLIGDIYGWVTGKGKEGRDALIPVLFGFLLALGSIPFLALFWGARTVDLYEGWRRFLAGYSLGGVTISPVGFLTFAIIFSVGYMLTKLVQGALRNSLLPKTTIDPGGQNAIVSGLGYLGITLAAVVAISSAGINLSSVAIVAGALSVGIGFGLQTIVSNFVSGIILLIERPISEGDWIEVGGQMGYVRDISVRATRIETFDRTDVIVPNSDLVSGTVTNFTRGNTIGRVIVRVGVAYGTDTKRVEGILREIANGHPMVLATPAPNIVFNEFGGDALEFEVRAILRDVNWVLVVKSDLNHEIAKRFAEEEIEIPFAQRDVWLRNPEALKGTAE